MQNPLNDPFEGLPEDQKRSLGQDMALAGYSQVQPSTIWAYASGAMIRMRHADLSSRSGDYFVDIIDRAGGKEAVNEMLNFFDRPQVSCDSDETGADEASSASEPEPQRGFFFAFSKTRSSPSLTAARDTPRPAQSRSTSASRFFGRATPVSSPGRGSPQPPTSATDTASTPADTCVSGLAVPAAAARSPLRDSTPRDDAPTPPTPSAAAPTPLAEASTPAKDGSEIAADVSAAHEVVTTRYLSDEDFHDIKRDVGQSLLSYRCPTRAERVAIARILQALAMTNPMLGHAQGMDAMVAFLVYETRSPKLAFYISLQVVDDVLAGCFHAGRGPFQETMAATVHLVRERLPHVARAIEHDFQLYERDLSMVLTAYFMDVLGTVFCRDLQPQVSRRLFDMVVGGGRPMVVATMLALLDNAQGEAFRNRAMGAFKDAVRTCNAAVVDPHPIVQAARSACIDQNILAMAAAAENAGIKPAPLSAIRRSTAAAAVDASDVVATIVAGDTDADALGKNTIGISPPRNTFDPASAVKRSGGPLKSPSPKKGHASPVRGGQKKECRK